jgi:hypothetical protein
LDKVSLLQTSQDVLLKNYAPSPEDGKFAVDLLHALQNDAPLTFLQKIFMFFLVAIPGSAEWKLSLFEKISSFSVVPAVATLAGGIFLIIYLVLLRKFGWRILNRKQKLIFLELTFPSTTSKSAYATEQLFTLFHSLAVNENSYPKSSVIKSNILLK